MPFFLYISSLNFEVHLLTLVTGIHAVCVLPLQDACDWLLFKPW